MGSFFDQQFAASAAPVLDLQFGEQVTLTRGTDLTEGVSASWVAHEFEVIDYQQQITVAVAGRKWFIIKTAYTINGECVTPLPGDTLTDDAGRQWEVLPRSNEPAVRTYSDSDYWEVATKQVV